MSKKFNYTPLLHTIIWLLYILSPLIFFHRNGDADIIHYSRHFIMALSLMLVFYLNYFCFVKRFLLKSLLREFFGINAIVILLCCAMNFAFHNCTEPKLEEARVERMIRTQKEFEDRMKEGYTHQEAAQMRIKSFRGKKIVMWDSLLRILACICVIGTAVALKSIQNLYVAEEKRKEEKRAKTEAELKNLKSQLNPHFLFNTLNNIYALIAISQEKSQAAVIDLSKMLRYILYEADAEEVEISKEINFIENYIKLMRLRLSDKVEVTTHFDITQNESLHIAPLLFITFVENAFKHGISVNEHSFVHFSIVETSPHTIECILENSCFPKDGKTDKSGSGIGLENLKRRLELIYPKRFQFSCGTENHVYKSRLIIDCSPKC